MRPLQTVVLPLLLALVFAAPAAADDPAPGEGAGTYAGSGRPAEEAPPADGGVTTDDKARGEDESTSVGTPALPDESTSLGEPSAPDESTSHGEWTAPEVPSAPDGTLLGDGALTDDKAAFGALAPMRGWAAPTKGGWISASYGIRGTHWVRGYHTGVDIAVPTGTPVRSVGPGQVIEARRDPSYGLYVKVRMNDGHYVLYGHLSRLRVGLWARVGGGQLIAYSGATGNVTGPHLHLEVRTQRGFGSDINPVTYLAKHRVSL
ncbi:hypothetical protein SRB5_39900 [Streptomyces sp. RB5]|uniref:M23ase beta-sheet core domain-containing protein n=1 Tax=Streptomyces smaragdinus TaxID=2585196 RepID=A0A7K0CM32_9ACTN|nr:M23 family metallopeptidase [Streptomyces smaragdinus]MQY13834.1 hypothetical protein [Streptomyces smaragdinus]